ncbi:MAG: FAD-dependent oxidoreductase [Inquilinaceae bacterium]
MDAHAKRVLIAGAGPAGVVAALILARAGIPVVVFESHPELPTDLRASTFHPPTLDMLAPLGLSDRLVEMGLKAPTYQFRDLDSGQHATFDLEVIADVTAYPFRLQCEQFKLTRLAVAALEREPLADIRFSSSVTGVTQDDTGAFFTVDGANGPETHRGAFAIGADGAGSAVRRAMGTAFDGFTYPEQWLVASTDVDFSEGLTDLANVSYTAHPDDWYVLLRVVGLWRVLLPVAVDVDPDDALSDATIERRLQGILTRAAPYPIIHRTLYRVHQRVASSYRAGRVLLAGDAAHINNPLGGMGMNGGVHDAVNLAQKLVRILNEGADMDRFLDHYARQRHDIAVEYVQAHTHGNKQTIAERDPQKRRETLERMQRIAADRDLLRAHVRKGAMIDAVEKSMAVDPP